METPPYPNPLWVKPAYAPEFPVEPLEEAFRRPAFESFFRSTPMMIDMERGDFRCDWHSLPGCNFPWEPPTCTCWHGRVIPEGADTDAYRSYYCCEFPLVCGNYAHKGYMYYVFYGQCPECALVHLAGPLTQREPAKVGQPGSLPEG